MASGASSELAALGAAADALPPAGDASSGGAAPGAPPQPEPDPGAANIAAIGFALTAFRTVATVMLKVESLQRTLSDEAIGQCAIVLAPVAEKYGIDLSGKAWALEITAAMTAGPILWTAWRELDTELKARRAKPITPDPAVKASANDE